MDLFLAWDILDLELAVVEVLLDEAFPVAVFLVALEDDLGVELCGELLVGWIDMLAIYLQCFGSLPTLEVSS